MKIKTAESNDLTILAMMYRQLCIDAKYRSCLSLEDLQKKMSNFIVKDGWIASLFYYEGQVIGYCLWQERSDAVYIRQFWIMRSQRRQGYGREFFRKLQQLQWDGKRLKLEVLYHNKRGESFWHAMGFAPYSITYELETTNNKRGHNGL